MDGVTCVQVWVGGMGVVRRVCGKLWVKCGSGFVGIPSELGACITVHGTLLVRAKPRCCDEVEAHQAAG